MTFVDTSAFFALLDRDDANHRKAKNTWADLLQAESRLMTSNYVVVESAALIQHRLGVEALRDFLGDMLPPVLLTWIGETVHQSAAGALLAASRRKLSLVDCASFEIMRQSGVTTAFTFDPHFDEQGFKRIP